jgi:hypothetical protein
MELLRSRWGGLVVFNTNEAFGFPSAKDPNLRWEITAPGVSSNTCV